MQKLIKLSNYYYVVDDKAEIKDLGEYYIDNDEPNKVVKIKHKFHLQQVNYGILKSECAKVIATTNPLLETSMILDIDKELIDKEVQVTFESVYIGKGNTIIAILKPISKETSQTCNICKHTIPGNLTECKNGTVSDCYKNSRFEPKETSTNEPICPKCNGEMKPLTSRDKCRSCGYETSTNTLEEIVLNCWNNTRLLPPPNQTDYTIGFIAGYKHCENKIYSEEELIIILQDYKEHCEECLEIEHDFTNVKEWFEPKHFNKRLNPNN